MFDNFINILKALKDSIITCTSGSHRDLSAYYTSMNFLTENQISF